MILLDSMILTPLGWSILSLAIVELIAFSKFIISLYSEISLLKNKIEENSKQDYESLKKLEKFDLALDTLAKERNLARDVFRNEVYKKITRVEEKVELKDKEINKRVNDIAQGLVIVETKIETKK